MQTLYLHYYSKERSKVTVVIDNHNLFLEYPIHEPQNIFLKTIQGKIARLEFDCKLGLFNLKIMSDFAERSAHQTQLQLSSVIFHAWAELTSFLFSFFFLFYRFFPLSLTWPRAGQAAPSGAEPTRLSRFYRPCSLYFSLGPDY